MRRENATKLLEPLRDLFAAMFFVVFGLNTDPTTIPPVLVAALVLALVTTLTKVATGWWAAQRKGIARMGRARAGAAVEPVATALQRRFRPTKTT